MTATTAALFAVIALLALALALALVHIAFRRKHTRNEAGRPTTVDTLPYGEYVVCRVVRGTELTESFTAVGPVYYHLIMGPNHLPASSCGAYWLQSSEIIQGTSFRKTPDPRKYSIQISGQPVIRSADLLLVNEDDVERLEHPRKASSS